MEGLFQPAHVLLVLLALVIAFGPAIIAVKVARARRARCSWSLAKARRRLWLGIVLIVLSLLPPPIVAQGDLWHALFLTIVMLPVYGLFWAAAAFQIAKASLRKRAIGGAARAASPL